LLAVFALAATPGIKFFLNDAGTLYMVMAGDDDLLSVIVIPATLESKLVVGFGMML